jgi:hypothetical protein
VYVRVGRDPAGSLLQQASSFEIRKQNMPSEEWSHSLKPFLALSLVVGIIDDLAFVLNLELLSQPGLLMSAAALIWAATLFFAVLSLHWRALWLLVGLPLVLLPFAGAVISAGMI